MTGGGRRRGGPVLGGCLAVVRWRGVVTAGAVIDSAARRADGVRVTAAAGRRHDKGGRSQQRQRRPADADNETTPRRHVPKQTHVVLECPWVWFLFSFFYFFRSYFF